MSRLTLVVFFATLLAAPALGCRQATCSHREATKTPCRFDYPDSAVLKTFTVRAPEKCCTLCSAGPGCKAWEFVQNRRFGCTNGGCLCTLFKTDDLKKVCTGINFRERLYYAGDK